MVNLKKNTVIKKDIVARVARESGFSQNSVATIVDKLLEVIVDEMSNGNNVQFRGFGAFVLDEREPKLGRNMHTDEAVQIPARVVPKFKPSECMKSVTIKEK